MISFLLFLVFGLIVGLLARAIMPGDQSMGWVATMLVGVLGSFVGGFLATLIFGGRFGELHTAGWVGSIVGALLVLFVTMKARGGRLTRV